MRYHPDTYNLRTLRGLRKGAEYFGMEPDKNELLWASKSYDTIAFEGWSHHHRLLGMICGNRIVQALFPLSCIVFMKNTVSRIRSGGRKDRK